MVVARWSFDKKARSRKGKVVGTKVDGQGNTRVIVDGANQGEYYFKPERLDNTEEIVDKVLDGDFDSETIGSVTSDVNELYYSTRKSSGWVGLDADMNEVTDTYGTHKELKEDHNVEGVKGFEVDGEKVYALQIHPDDR